MPERRSWRSALRPDAAFRGKLRALRSPAAKSIQLAGTPIAGPPVAKRAVSAGVTERQTATLSADCAASAGAQRSRRSGTAAAAWPRTGAGAARIPLRRMRLPGANECWTSGHPPRIGSCVRPRASTQVMGIPNFLSGALPRLPGGKSRVPRVRRWCADAEGPADR